MDEREFFDQLYQEWMRTTGHEERYWVPEEHFDKSGRWNIYAVLVADATDRKLVASGLTESDTDFITGIHGALPEIVGRVHEALDEADRADYDRDSRECRIAELESENKMLREELDW